jgi:glutathione S-transferase
MQLYEFPPTRSIRARWTLQELELDFESITVDLRKGEGRRPEFLKLNPAGKIPVLVDGDLVLSESVAILLYLGEKYPQAGLVPSDLRERADLNRWLLFTATELEQPLWRIARHGFLYPPEKRSPADIALAREDFGPMGAVVEEHLRDRKFVVGERFSIGDILLACTLDWADEETLLGELPRSRAYMERMYARPKAGSRIAPAFASLPPV